MWKKLLSSARKKKKKKRKKRLSSEPRHWLWGGRQESVMALETWPLAAIYVFQHTFQTFYWLRELPRCRTPLEHLPRTQHERFSGRVQEHLHGGPLQAGLRLRGRRLRWGPAAPGEARRQVQVLEAGVPSPVEGETAHRQLAAPVQAEEVDPGRHRGGADSRDPAHSSRWVVTETPLHREQMGHVVIVFLLLVSLVD